MRLRSRDGAATQPRRSNGRPSLETCSQNSIVIGASMYGICYGL